jgi:hypothetical protein
MFSNFWKVFEEKISETVIFLLFKQLKSLMKGTSNINRIHDVQSTDVLFFLLTPK